ncbi:MAG: SLC13 family permease [Synergistaceae bacterium]|jgi:anion transporter|nr:SLC13 family permease [Synergistaceae bacterium]
MKKGFALGFTSLLATLACSAPALAAEAAKAAAAPDNTKAYITLGILVVAGVLFIFELIPLPITAMVVPVSLAVSGVITGHEAFQEFGNDTVILFMAMFIIGESIFKTGFADKIGKFTTTVSGGNETKLLLMIVLVVGLMSGVLSNTGTVAVMMPMVIAMCVSSKIAPSKMLIPCAFASSMGGMLTLIGTPPNGSAKMELAKYVSQVASTAASGTPIYEMQFFDYAWFGIPVLAVGLLYYALIGRHFLTDTSKRVEAAGDISDEEGKAAKDAARAKRRPEKMNTSVVIFVLTVLLMVLGDFKITDKIPVIGFRMPLHVAAMLGVCLIVISKTLTMKEAFESVDYVTIWLFAGMLSMSTAMSKSGAAKLLAENITTLSDNPTVVLAAVCLLTQILTNLMSNTATAALMCPIASAMATGMGVSPMPLVLGVAFSASACFLTPIATPPNTIIFGPGKYRFLDYAKVGWPLQAIVFVMCVYGIPLIWPW